MERLLGFCGGDVSDRAGRATIGIPIDPFLGFLFDFAHRFPRADLVDDLGFEQACDTLGQCVVIGITDGFNREIDLGCGQSLGIFDRQILRSTVGMVDQVSVIRRFSLPDRLILSFEGEPGRHGCGHAPCCYPKGIRVQITRGYDPSCENVDHKCHVNAAGRGGHTGEVARNCS